MAGTTDKYINLFTDFGFKKLFGEEPNKDLLISFLNALLADEEQISDLSYLKNERLGKNEDERKAVYDMYCTNAEGEKFIVEIQRVKQEFFKDRSLYYATFAIQEQALKGRRWNYKLKKVYTIAVLDFEFEDTKPDKLHHRVCLMEEETKEIFYERLRFIYLEIPKFNKELKELTSDYERWLFAFKNLHRLREMPKELEEGLFNKLFELAEIAKMKPKEQTVYRDSLKDYWDLKNAMETSLKEGKALGLAEGLAEGKAQGLVEGKNKGIIEAKLLVAKQMLKDGEPVDKIIRYTGLSAAELEALI